jgi:hypothetical protein
VSERLRRVAGAAALLAVLAAAIGLAYTVSAWLHDSREHAGVGHGPGAVGLAVAAACLVAALAARLALRRGGRSAR